MCCPAKYTPYTNAICGPGTSCQFKPLPIHIHKRTVPRVCIDAWPVDKAEGIGLGVAACGGVVMAVPVVGEACLDLEDLAGEAQVEACVSGFRPHGTNWLT